MIYYNLIQFIEFNEFDKIDRFILSQIQNLLNILSKDFDVLAKIILKKINK